MLPRTISPPAVLAVTGPEMRSSLIPPPPVCTCTAPLKSAASTWPPCVSSNTSRSPRGAVRLRSALRQSSPPCTMVRVCKSPCRCVLTRNCRNRRRASASLRALTRLVTVNRMTRSSPPRTVTGPRVDTRNRPPGIAISEPVMVWTQNPPSRVSFDSSPPSAGPTARSPTAIHPKSEIRNPKSIKKFPPRRSSLRAPFDSAAERSCYFPWPPVAAASRPYRSRAARSVYQWPES